MTRASAGVSYGGVGLALLAFLVTRLLVAGALEPDAVSFMVAGVVPLVAGLGLALFGVVLAVGSFAQTYARTVWVGAVFGTLATVVILLTTAIHSILVGDGLEPLLDSAALVGNVVLGGAIAGAIAGDRSARGRQRRTDLARYAERAMLVNRLLRHEVTNATTVVKGYADELGSDGDADPATVIRDSATAIEERVSQISDFAATDPDRAAVAVAPVLESVLDEYEAPTTERSPGDDADSAATSDATVDATIALADDVRVLADRRLELLVRELLDNAFEHAGPDATVELAAEADDEAVTLTVRDDGPGLPDAARSVLETPGLPETDDARFGYGLQMVRLLVDHYGGEVSLDCDDGTVVTVTLERPPADRTVGLAAGVPTQDLYRTAAAAVVAGLFLGVALEVLAGAIPAIGGLYGVESAVVGWVAHLFHSVLFGLLFAAALRARPVRRRVQTDWQRTLAGAAWGLLVWTVAAVTVPLWLGVAGSDAQFPALGVVGLVPHLLWGGLLGWLDVAFEDSARLEALLGRLPDGQR